MSAHEARPEPLGERRDAKASRLNLRTTGRQDALIRDAAEAVNKSVSEFVLDSATVAAERVLADRRLFSLDDDAWRRFEEALDRPSVAMPRLRALLREPSAGPFEI